LPVVFPEPIFPSIETIKHPDDDDDDDTFASLENEAEAPIFFKLVFKLVFNANIIFTKNNQFLFK
jgi:hypothetical protein